MQRAFYILGIAAFLISISVNVVGPAMSGTITKPNTFSALTTISSSQVNANFDTAYNEINGLLDSANIENETLLSEDILNSTLTTSDVLDGTLTASDMAGGAAVANLSAHTVTGGTGGHLASGTIVGGNIATGNVTESHMGTGSVNSTAIRDFSIVGGNGGDIASGTITGGNIATANVTEDHLATDSVRTAAIQSQAVASDEILNFSIVGGNGGDIASGTITGGNIATDNVTTSLILDGTIVDADMSALSLVPVGVVLDYAAGTSAPTGWLFCNGQAVSRSTYSALFAVIGETYGIGNGSTTFNVPDCRGRVIAGEDDMGGTSSQNRLTDEDVTNGIDGDTLADTGGNQGHQLVTAEIPAHTHTVGAAGADDAASGSAVRSISGGTTSSGTTGSGGRHNNVQPTIIMTKIIKAGA